MAFSTILLLIALFNPPMQLALAASCIILGMQNGMFIFYKDILIRTTHFSGYLTDAGLALGMVLRGKRHELKRCLFYVSGIVCFITGAAASVFVAPQVFFYTAAFLYFLTGLFYFIFRTYETMVYPAADTHQ